MEDAVFTRYKIAAKKVEKSLCCPTSYNASLLKVIPEEILEKDYGCGDPSQFIKEGETVLDLGSGAGKLCYIIAQVVGAKGKVIGIDMNDEMLRVARKYQKEIGNKLGYHNVEFKKGKIQNLRLDLEKVDEYLKENPIKSSDDITFFNAFCEKLEKTSPLVEENAVDVVVSNCVLNLVKDEDKKQLFKEIYRVLKVGGRAVISDIISDEDIPRHMKEDEKLWSGCISGAFREDLFLEAFKEAGFHGIEIVKWDDKPWQVIGGVEFRSVTVVAFKGKEGPSMDKGHGVIYRGPYSKVEDDDGHIFERGKRVAICEKTFQVLSRLPYQKDFIFITPRKDIVARPFPCQNGTIYRTAKETKGSIFTTNAGDCSNNLCCQSWEPFSEKLKKLDIKFTKGEIKTIQINMGSRCNQSCFHCHWDASRDGTLMDDNVLNRVLKFLMKNRGLTVDITGGAPELHPKIEKFLSTLSEHTSKICFRTNLTALAEKKELIQLFKRLNIEIIASLPDVLREKTDFVRGNGVFTKSIKILKILNENGFGTELPLHLVHNPEGFFLSETEKEVEKRYKDVLGNKYKIAFNELFIINNMPIGRFKRWLEKEGYYDEYRSLLYANFNVTTLDNLMCKSLINIGYDGRVFDCDFNNALALARDEKLENIDIKGLFGSTIIVGDHCYGCAALKGSGCYGSVIK